MFDAKVLIKRLPSFNVPKITVIRTRETNLKVAVNVTNPNSLMKSVRTLKAFSQMLFSLQSTPFDVPHHMLSKFSKARRYYYNGPI